MATANVLTYTPADLLRMPDGKDYELADGLLVERKMGSESSFVGGRLFRRLANHADDQRVGLVWPADNGIQCFPDAPDKVRRPDVTFVRFGRLPGDRPPLGHLLIAPDLAVEVISPNELAYEVDCKVDEYLAAGVRLVWVINPANRTVRIYRADGSIGILRESDELDGEDVVPGFRCPVRDLFPAAATP
jgi:Uma2 family endonuclease